MWRSSLRAGIALAMAALLLTSAACDQLLRPGIDSEQLVVETPYVSPYDWDCLALDGGRFEYSIGGQRVSRTGIDVSSHQGAIDWQAVAGDGIEFAFIRLGNRGFTEGQLYLDERFEENWLGAHEAGIPTGVYFFSQAINEEEAREEASFVLQALEGRELAYPVVFDFETVAEEGGRANSLTRHQATNNALAFCKAIEAGGYKAMIYGNKRDIARYYLEVIGEWDVWFAEYDADHPGGQFDFTIWQYANNGQVDGIATGVDMNIELLGA